MATKGRLILVFLCILLAATFWDIVALLSGAPISEAPFGENKTLVTREIDCKKCLTAEPVWKRFIMSIGNGPRRELVGDKANIIFCVERVIESGNGYQRLIRSSCNNKPLYPFAVMPSYLELSPLGSLSKYSFWRFHDMVQTYYDLPTWTVLFVYMICLFVLMLIFLFIFFWIQSYFDPTWQFADNERVIGRGNYFWGLTLRDIESIEKEIEEYVYALVHIERRENQRQENGVAADNENENEGNLVDTENGQLDLNASGSVNESEKSKAEANGEDKDQEKPDDMNDKDADKEIDTANPPPNPKPKRKRRKRKSKKMATNSVNDGNDNTDTYEDSGDENDDKLQPKKERKPYYQYTKSGKRRARRES